MFDVPFKPDAASYSAVARMLALVSEELEDAFRQMRATDHSMDLYHSAFNKARAAIGLESLRASWKSVRVNLDGDTLKLIKFCSEVLPEEGLRVPEEQLEGLRQILEELRQAVSDGDMPQELRSFIVSQVEIIERALQDFPIVGEKAFNRAVGQVLVSYPAYDELRKRHQSAQELALLDRAWNKILTWSSRLSALRNLLDTGRGLSGLLGPGEHG